MEKNEIIEEPNLYELIEDLIFQAQALRERIRELESENQQLRDENLLLKKSERKNQHWIDDSNHALLERVANPPRRWQLRRGV